MLVLEMDANPAVSRTDPGLQHCHTIGIGAGSGTAGQVLVMHDMLGMNLGKMARFVHNFMQDSKRRAWRHRGLRAGRQADRFPDNAVHAW